jgi:hypothetical protein
MTPGGPDPARGDASSDQSGGKAPPRRRLSLDDPVSHRAAEDRPESWGDQDSDGDREARYVRERPPHHGG